MGRASFFSNTLQSIAVGYLIATVALVHLRVRGQIVLTGGLPAIYALLLAFVPVPRRAENVGAYTPEANLGIWIDKVLLLALFHGVIDVLGFRRWSFPFVVIGANAIVAYMVFQLIDLKAISRRLFGGLAAHTGNGADFVIAAGAFGILWFVLWYLYRNRTFIRV